jgi:hypothetical protein
LLVARLDRDNVQFSLETLFLIVSALGCYLAAVVVLRELGATLAAVGAAALVRTVVQTSRLWQHGYTIRLAEKLGAYLASLAATFAAVAAAGGALLAGTLMLTITAVVARVSTNYLVDFAAGTIGVLGAHTCLLAAVPVFHTIYWQTLPPLSPPDR